MAESRTARRRRQIAAAAAAAVAGVLILASLTGVAARERGNAGPDVIVSDLHQTRYWGEVDGIHAYSVGTVSCNLGAETLPWDADTNNHPVIAQNMYRLKEGRFQQIGMSWIKHGFNSLNDDLCGAGCTDPFDFQVLGIGCSDPYSAGTNGRRETFGPG